MELSEHISKNRDLAECICRRLHEEIDKLGFAAHEIRYYPSFGSADFALVKDPYTGDNNLACYWYDDIRQRIGRLQFNSDGSFYAEFDVVKTHPAKAGWFVEGVNAWGNAFSIKAEAKLLPMPG